MLTTRAAVGTRMRDRLRKVGVLAVGAAMAITATMTAGAIPAGADSGVRVTVSNAGHLTINGTNNSERIEINANGSGLAVWIFDRQSNLLDVHNVTGVTGNITINLKGGDDRVELGNLTPTSVPGNITIKGGSGDDDVATRDLEVGGSLTFLPGNGGNLAANSELLIAVDSTIDGNVVIKSGASGQTVTAVSLVGSQVAGKLDARAIRNRRLGVAIIDSSVGKLSVRGSGGVDRVHFKQADLGSNPFVSLGNGDDQSEMPGPVSWSGLYRHRDGGGDDWFWMADSAGLSRLNLSMGGGDDFFDLGSSLINQGAGSVLNGGGGNDTIDGVSLVPRARVRGFETTLP